MSVRHASKAVVDALPFSRSTYVCRQCRRHARPSQVLIQQRQYASESGDGLPLAERVRRKLWKGKPPGPENVDDLYGGPGALETMFKERRERQSRGRSEHRPMEPREQAIDEPIKPQPVDAQARVETPQTDAPSIESMFSESDAKNTRSTHGKRRRERKLVQSEAEPEQPTQKLAPMKVEEGIQEYNDPDYKQATTWDGLQIAGHKGHWKEMPYKKEDDYYPWLPLQVRKEWSYIELVSLMHQAITECHALKKSSVSLKELAQTNFGPNSPLEPQTLESATFRLSSDGTIESVDGLNTPTLPFDESCYNPTPEEETSPSYERMAVLMVRTEPELAPTQERLLYTPRDTSFLNATLKLTHPLTIHILKRFTKLTNHSIPDPLLTELTSSIPPKNTIATFLVAMAEKTKKKDLKVAELLMQDPVLAEQRNLLVLGRRETPVDKEKEVGRWKVIEEELKARGLPVLGRVEIQR